MILLLVPLAVSAESAPIPPPVVVSVAPVTTPATHDGVPMATGRAVTLKTSDGTIVTTGEAEAAVAVVPIDDLAVYRYDLCLKLAEAKPWSDWDCVKP